MCIYVCAHACFFSVLEDGDNEGSALRAGPSSRKMIAGGNKQGRTIKELTGLGQASTQRMEMAGGYLWGPRQEKYLNDQSFATLQRVVSSEGGDETVLPWKDPSRSWVPSRRKGCGASYWARRADVKLTV